MFNIGPLELVVLAIVALVVLGPEKLPGFARDAARLLRTLRELATGARQQLRDELGPEFADIDFRNLNPRTAITRAVFGDEPPDLTRYNPRNFDARSAARDFFADDDPAVGQSADPSARADEAAVSMRKEPSAGAEHRPRPRPRPPVNGSSINGSSVNGNGRRASGWDVDAT